jgi:hypothetical protein
MTESSATPNPPAASSVRPHFYVLLDRSGSMSSMRSDVIGGFNNLIAEQQADGPDARITLVQFDSQDPHEVLIDARRITHAQPLTEPTFVPRGGTPLLDATGRLIAKASVREHERSVLGKRPEAVTVITITDGHENQSVEYTRRDIVRLVKEKEAHGWTFAFLGAGLDAYGEAGGMGYDARSVQAFAPDGTGAAAAFQSVSGAMVNRRAKLRRGEAHDHADFYEGIKAAEEDRRRRHGQ